MRLHHQTTHQRLQAQPLYSALFLALALAPPSLAGAQTSSPSLPAAHPAPVRRIVVSIPDRKLALLENDHIVKVYSVAIGAPESPSPSGEFQIVQRLENPTYFRPGVVIGPGSSNPLGTRWMGLNVKGFGIHGTNRPSSVGKNASHGCVRLRNRDMEDLFSRVHVGDRVSLLAERTTESAQIFGVPTNDGPTQVARNDVREPNASEQRGE
jgi:lipoprotein-anchoring transpeptidase ErfK/SrfK